MQAKWALPSFTLAHGLFDRLNWLEHIHAVNFGGRFDVDDLFLRLSKLLHIWPQSLRVLAMLPTYCQKMQNQSNMRVLLSILAVLHNLTNGIKHNAPPAPITRTTL
jgi:hypothetical protein